MSIEKEEADRAEREQKGLGIPLLPHSSRDSQLASLVCYLSSSSPFIIFSVLSSVFLIPFSLPLLSQVTFDSKRSRNHQIKMLKLNSSVIPEQSNTHTAFPLCFLHC
jgi:hypothetical protein